MNSIPPAPMDSLPPTAILQPPLQTTPFWIIPALWLLHGASAILRKRPLSILTISLNSYLLLHFALYPPAGRAIERILFGQNLFMIAARTINLILLRRPEEISRLDPSPLTHAKSADTATDSDTVKANPKVPKPEQTLWTILTDILTLPLALRGVGWSFQAKRVPPAAPQTYPRLTFILSTLSSLLWRYLLIDVLSTLIRYARLNPGANCAPLTSRGMGEQVAWGAATSAMGAWSTEVIASLAALVAVGTGSSRPAEWPPFFGSVADAWTVRRFWSHYWHQAMRLVAEPPVHYLSHRVCNIKRGTPASNYGKVFGAFFVTFSSHGYGSYLAGSGWRGDWMHFMGQAVAIWVEEQVIMLARAAGSWESKWTRAVGYVWAAGFVSWSSLWLTPQIIAAGAYEEPPFAISVTEALVRVVKGIVKVGEL